MADDFATVIGPELASAIAKKGYETLTLVQHAVLAPELAGRDLRISSQTGSGKTVAIGFTIRTVVVGDASPSPKGAARPLALVVTPTRELAKQVETELAWLFAPLKVGVASVTGGGNYRDERRALGSGCAIVVGTPGRLLDHLQRGAIDGTNLGAVVLDEADRMLDLGFRDDLEAILAFAPEGHRTHLVSATFPREVLALANRVQSDPVRIEGTPLGTANTDIEHLVHLVLPHERLDAIINLMLETPDATTLIFARTRADVGELTHLLSEEGFVVDSLSGEMEQRERNKALAAFKRGDLDALVATDVAARGIDVQDVARVLHAEPPMDPDSYTHRSGRTGRAGRKGKSSVLVTPPALNRVSSLLKRAGVRWKIDPVPTAETIEAAREERLVTALTHVPPPEDPAEPPAKGEGGEDGEDGGRFVEADDRSWALAKRIAATGEATRALARMIARTRARGPEARAITVIEPPGGRKKPWEDRVRGPAYADVGPGPRARAGAGATRAPEGRPGFGERRPFDEHRSFGEPRGLRPDRASSDGREGPTREPGPPRTARDPATDAGQWVTFRVSWGQVHGADARRLLAMACRRGGIRGSDVGSIRVQRTFSTVDVAAAVAEGFERSSSEPDPRDARVKIHRASEGAGHEGAEMERPARADRRPRTTLREAPTGSADREGAEARQRKAATDGEHAERGDQDPDAERAAAPADRPSRTADRASKTADRASVPADRASRTADRASKTADRASAPADRSSKTVDRPSKTADRASKTADRASKTADRGSKTADRASATAGAELPSKTSRPDADRPAPPDRASRSAYGDRRPRPSQPERYARRPAPSAGARPPYERPSHDAPRGPSARGDAPRGEAPRGEGPRSEGPRGEGPRSGGPRHDGPPRSGGPRHDGPPPGRRPYDGPPSRGDRPRQDGPRPPFDRSRPSHDGPRSSNDRHGPPSRGGPPPSHDGPRPPHDGPRPPYAGSRPAPGGGAPAYGRPRPHSGPPRPSGPPPSRQGDARPKRKKP